MELRDVETFLVVAEELHIRRAAARLGLSAARVSQIVRALEVEVGAPLFARHTRHVRLTRVGKRFRARAERAITELRCAMREAQVIARDISGQLRVGYFIAIGGASVALLADAFEARFPHSQVLINPLSRGAAFGSLREGEIDLLLAWSPGGTTDAVRGDGRAAAAVLASDPRAVLVAADHPLAAFEQVSIEQVAEHEILNLHSDTPRAFGRAWTPDRTPAGTPIRRTACDLAATLDHTPAYLEELYTAVARSHIVHLTSCSVLEHHPYPGLAVVPVHDLPPLVMTLVWQTERETTAIRSFAETAEVTARDPSWWAVRPNPAPATPR